MTQIKVTFDQGHDNLIDPSSEATDDQSFLGLVNLLQEADFQIGEPIEGKLTPISLFDSRVFVFAAPTGQLTGDEINFIWRFVQEGGGLLLLNNADAFQHQVYSLNTLAERVGCRFGFYAAYEPLALTDFEPHYISGSVDEVKIGEKGEQVLSRITSVESDVNLQPIVHNDYSLLLAAGTCREGRIVVAGNTAMLSNKYIEQPGNRRLALNTFRWLAGLNPFDLAYVTPRREIELGQRYVFEISLLNPTSQPTKIQEVSLNSSVNDEISQQSVQDIVLYPDQDGSEIQKLRWEIEPQDVLGDHILRLRIRYEQGEAFYQRMVSFTVIMPGHTRLVISRKENDVKRNILVGEPFEVTGIGAMSGLREQSVEFTPKLDCPTEELYEVQSAWPTELRWTLVARMAGTHPIALRIEETGQTVQTHVVIKESEASQIEAITTRFVKPLDDEIRRILPDLSSALATPELAQVPFKLLTIEDYISIAFPFEPAAQQVWDVVEAAYWEDEENERVVADLLYNLAPMYMPRKGAFVPFGPDLVHRLIKTGTSRRRELLVNFLKGDEETDVEMRRLIASYLSHEKYGHGFFYTCTKLGQQLAILDKHQFLDRYAEHILRKPYPKELYDSYREAIKVLQHSALIVNEGFAAWLELNVLRSMEPEIHAIIQERERFMQEAKTLRDVKRDSLYFDKFPPASGLDSPYEEGRQYLDSIQKLYSKDYGTKCAIQAFLVATSIPLGITDVEEAPSFALAPNVLRNAILGKEEGDARSDLRLWRISRVLEDTRESVRAEQERLQCHRVCLHPECPVRAQIAKKLGWRANDDGHDRA